MATIIRRNTLSYTSLQENSNKYYSLELKEEGANSYCIFIQYGRIGQVQKQDKKLFATLECASREYDKILKSKLKKGYTEKDLATYSVGSADSIEKINLDKVIVDEKTKTNKNEEPKTKKRVKKLDPLVKKLVIQIFEEASNQLKNLGSYGSGSFETNASSPLGKLSLFQINKGREILEQIALATNYQMKLNLCEEYFKVIPKVFGHKISISDIDISSNEKLAEQSSILDFYEEALKLKELFEDNNLSVDEDILRKYESLKCDIKPLDKESDKYKKICEKIRTDESRHHNVHISVKNIYSVKQKNAVEFDKSCGNVKELYHGTRSANIPAILSTNLKMPKALKGVYITGAMFGPGIYFADSSTKSSQYSCSKFGGKINKHQTAYMFICDVALGKMKPETSATYHTSAPSGYNSVKGCEGRNLLHNEYIIYNENQQKIKYIVEFDTYRKR